ncbi:glycoside hydrolase [Whalleya microplaca]|nr:glycoside hydrolase [Whalleya microplaca]
MKHRLLEFFALGLATLWTRAAGAPAQKYLLDTFAPTKDTLPLLQSREILRPRAELPTGTCNEKTPCPITARCGTNRLCGYDFCEAGCQHGFGGCGKPNRPSCGGGSSANKRTVGYYESWSNTRKCQAIAPEDLNLNGFTHINFAFAFFDPSTFKIAPMDGKSGGLYNRFTALKDTHSGLQTWISVGGWSFTDPGPTRVAFSDMSNSARNRGNFINGLKNFMDTYGFDGVDIDWEYPQADDRGGAQSDTANFVTLVKEMRATLGNKYGTTITLPTSYWYLQHFDLAGLQPNIDWFNLMSYDLHGVWDAQSKSLGPYIAPHTNITEIDLGLDLLWRAGVDSSKVVLGQGWYGRSFTLKDPSCNVPNGLCQFSGGANAGPCSNAEGILDLQEIKDIISQNNPQPSWDKNAGVKWITWDSNQWVSYDDDDTFRQKRDFANDRCLGGTMVWAMDQVDQKADNGLAPAPGVTIAGQEDAKSKMNDLGAGISCYTTDCNMNCMKGTNQVAQMNGQPGQLSTNGRCPKGQYRNLCCADGTNMEKCQWRGFRGVGLSCIGGCDDGETEVVKDTNNHVKKKDQDCTGGLQSFCCKNFKPAPNSGDLAKEAATAAKAALEAAAEQAALDIAAKVFCRVAVPALLAPLEAVEALIPIVGEIADVIEIAATPLLIEGCIKGIEKTGKAEFKVFGKKHTLSIDKPSGTPTIRRPPESSHPPAKTSSDACPQVPNKRDLDARAGRCRETHVTRTIAIEDSQGTIKVVNIDCAANPQPCLHYNSIIRNHPNINYRKTPCPYKRQDARMQADLIPPIAGAKGCEADEWPPAALYFARDGYDQLEGHGPPRVIDKPQYIRYLDGNQNGRVGGAWRCPAIAQRELINPSTHEKTEGRTTTFFTDYTDRFTRTTYRVEFAGLVQLDNDDGLEVNSCYPRGDPGHDYRGYALLNYDPWYGHNAHAPDPASYMGKPPFKRDLVDPDLLIVVEANTSRKATDEELRDRLGLRRCQDKGCESELNKFMNDVVTVHKRSLEELPNAPVVEATAPPSFGMAALDKATMPRKGVRPVQLPSQTQA